MSHAASLPDHARVRAVLDFARATDAPPEAIGWLFRLSREAETRRATRARDVTPVALAPLLADRCRGHV